MSGSSPRSVDELNGGILTGDFWGCEKLAIGELVLVVVSPVTVSPPLVTMLEGDDR